MTYITELMVIRAKRTRRGSTNRTPFPPSWAPQAAELPPPGTCARRTPSTTPCTARPRSCGAPCDARRPACRRTSRRLPHCGSRPLIVDKRPVELALVYEGLAELLVRVGPVDLVEQVVDVLHADGNPLRRVERGHL